MRSVLTSLLADLTVCKCVSHSQGSCCSTSRIDFFNDETVGKVFSWWLIFWFMHLCLTHQLPLLMTVVWPALHVWMSQLRPENECDRMPEHLHCVEWVFYDCLLQKLYLVHTKLYKLASGIVIYNLGIPLKYLLQIFQILCYCVKHCFLYFETQCTSHHHDSLRVMVVGPYHRGLKSCSGLCTWWDKRPGQFNWNTYQWEADL